MAKHLQLASILALTLPLFFTGLYRNASAQRSVNLVEQPYQLRFHELHQISSRSMVGVPPSR